MINGCICKEIIIQIPERTITYQHSLFRKKIKYSQNKPFLQEEELIKYIFFNKIKSLKTYIFISSIYIL